MAENTHILVVDDDARLRALLDEFLSKEGYAVSVAKDATEAQALMKLWWFNAMILDVMMPGMDGVSFARELAHSHPQLPILMLTAKGESADRITGLEAGVADYLPKPFEPRELMLRLRNLTKTKQADTQETIALGHYVLNRLNGELTENGAPLKLTDKDTTVLKTLAQHLGAPASREQLAAALGVPDRHVDVAINRLRKKIEPNAAQPRYIMTVRGQGYRLRMEG